MILTFNFRFLQIFIAQIYYYWIQYMQCQDQHQIKIIVIQGEMRAVGKMIKWKEESQMGDFESVGQPSFYFILFLLSF